MFSSFLNGHGWLDIVFVGVCNELLYCCSWFFFVRLKSTDACLWVVFAETDVVYIYICII